MEVLLKIKMPSKIHFEERDGSMHGSILITLRTSASLKHFDALNLRPMMRLRVKNQPLLSSHTALTDAQMLVTIFGFSVVNGEQVNLL